MESFLASRRREPDWLQHLRQCAWQTFQQREFPSRREEEWMRTDIRLFHLEDYELPTDRADATPARALLSEGVQLGGQTVSVNGRFLSAQLNDRWSDRGVLFGDLAQLVLEHGDRLRPYLQQLVRPDTDKFSALHAACWSSGTLLYVPRGVAIDEPLYAQSTIAGHGVDLGHTLVILEDGAEATFLNELGSRGPQDSGLHCGATEVILQRGARLRLVNLQDWGTNVWHFAHQRAVVGQDASLQWTIGALGSRLSKVNQHVVAGRAGGRNLR